MVREAAESGFTRPTAVILPRFRSIAVIGIASSSASQISYHAAR